MANGKQTDASGNFHAENGQFISLEKHIEFALREREKQMERIFAERETSTEFKRVALESKVNDAKLTTATALQEQKLVTEQKISDAKNAADDVVKGVNTRLDKLESGGAPFANRLDEGLTKLRKDVDLLNVDSVRTKVLDALREQTAVDTKLQKRQVRAALVTGAIALGLAAFEALSKL